MIKNEQQYLRIFLWARQFERSINRLRPQLSNELSTLLRVELEALQIQRDELLSQLAEYDAVHTADRKGDWIPTFTGRRCWLLDTRPEDIDITDIAQGLSRISRYNGATLGEIGYTVAQHSVLASWIVGSPYRLAVLLHDAPEAYVGDVITPLKHLLGATYENIEDGIMGAVARRYGFAFDDDVRKVVRWADHVMLATEVRDLVPLHALRREPVEGPMPSRIEPWTQEESRRAFLQRFEELK